MTGSEVDVLRKHNVVAFLCLSQIIHVVADVIVDWDLIVDCFEQMLALIIGSCANTKILPNTTLLSNGSAGSSPVLSPQLNRAGYLYCEEDISTGDIMHVLKAIDKFKKYALFLSDETLVHLMTSLVSLSIATVSSSAFCGCSINMVGNVTGIDILTFLDFIIEVFLLM